jgi:dTDP-4-amino-4,6-dideoxygalactose transaminase
MRVPLADLGRLHAPIRPALEAAFARVVDGGRFVNGPEVEAFEHEAAVLAGARQAIGVSSGTDALLAILMALGVGPGDEVVTPAFSFCAAAEGVARLGATPVFADVDEDFLLDVASAAELVGPRTRAILFVDLFGRRLSAGALEALSALGVPLVEDAAQAFGAPGVGAGVRAAAISFFPTKNLGALGDAGLVLTDDLALGDAVRMVRGHGCATKYVHEVLGGNMRLDALQAALLRAKMAHLARWNAMRREHAHRYLAGLAGLPALGLPRDAPEHVWHHLVVRVDPGASEPRRAALRGHLAERGVETEVYYPRGLHEQACFASSGSANRRSLPRTEAAAREVLALPLHAALDAAQVDHAVRAVRSFFEG